jgi:hypothetical protein
VGSRASLNRSPKISWVEKSGGLPGEFREVVRGIMRSGKTLEQAIAAAWGTFRRWARGGADVKPETRAKAVRVLAQLEAMRAKNKARQVATAHPVGAGSELLLAAPRGESLQARRELLKKGQALPPASPGGQPGYPIPDVAHLRKAMRAFGRTPSPARRRALVALIRRAAAKLGVLGEEWVQRFLREHAGGTRKDQAA